MREISKLLAQLLIVIPKATTKVIYTWVVEAIKKNDPQHLAEVLETLDRVPDNKSENSLGNGEKIAKVLLNLEQSQLTQVIKILFEREEITTFGRGSNLLGRIIQQSNTEAYKELVVACFRPMREAITESKVIVNVRASLQRPEGFNFEEKNKEAELAKVFKKCVDAVFQSLVRNSSNLIRVVIDAAIVELKARKTAGEVVNIESTILAFIPNRFLAAILVQYAKNNLLVDKNLHIWFFKILPIAVQSLGSLTRSKDPMIPEKILDQVFDNTWRAEIVALWATVSAEKSKVEGADTKLQDFFMSQEDLKIFHQKLLESISGLATAEVERNAIVARIAILKDKLKIITFRNPKTTYTLSLEEQGYIAQRLRDYRSNESACKDENIKNIYSQSEDALKSLYESLTQQLQHDVDLKGKIEKDFQTDGLPKLIKFADMVAALPCVEGVKKPTRHVRTPASVPRERSATVDSGRFFVVPQSPVTVNSNKQENLPIVASSSSNSEIESPEVTPSATQSKQPHRPRARSTIKEDKEGQVLKGKHGVVKTPLLGRAVSVANLGDGSSDVAANTNSAPTIRRSNLPRNGK